MPDSPSTARELPDAVPEFTKGCVGVQPGPRISLPTCRACIPGEKNDCDRTRKQWTAIQTGNAHSADTNDAGTIHQQIIRTGQGWWALPPGYPLGPPRFSASAPISERNQNRDAVRHPVSDRGPRVGARVASPRRPILRSGQIPVYLPLPRGTTAGARRGQGEQPAPADARHPDRVGRYDRPEPKTGRTLGRTDGSGRVIREPRRSILQ